MISEQFDAETPARWLKACARSACVEVGAIGEGQFGIRDSKNPAGPVLMFDRDEFTAFLDAARRGDFDELLPG